MGFFDYLKIFLIALLVFAVIVGLAYWLATVDMENTRARSAEAWNGGICPDCGKLIHTYEYDFAEGTGEERRELKGKEG